jgi:hypothetical protein
MERLVIKKSETGTNQGPGYSEEEEEEEGIMLLFFINLKVTQLYKGQDDDDYV